MTTKRCMGTYNVQVFRRLQAHVCSMRRHDLLGDRIITTMIPIHDVLLGQFVFNRHLVSSTNVRNLVYEMVLLRTCMGKHLHDYTRPSQRRNRYVAGCACSTGRCARAASTSPSLHRPTCPRPAMTSSPRAAPQSIMTFTRLG